MNANHFVGAVYFNVDYTNALHHELVGEADWAIINTTIGKFYEGFWDLYSSSKSDFSSLLKLFGLTQVQVNGKEKFVPQIAVKNLNFIEPIVNEKITNPKEKSDFYLKVLQTPSGQKGFDKAIEVLAEEYQFLTQE